MRKAWLDLLGSFHAAQITLPLNLGSPCVTSLVVGNVLVSSPKCLVALAEGMLFIVNESVHLLELCVSSQATVAH